MKVWEGLAKAGDSAQSVYYTGYEEISKGWAYLDKGQTSEALASAGRAAQAYTQAFQAIGMPLSDSTEFSTALKQASRAHRNMGQFQKAENFIRDSLKVVGSAYGRRHPLYADRLVDLSEIHRRKGEFAPAELALREARELLEKAYDGPHRDIADLDADLGRVYQDQSQYPRAEEMYRRGLTTHKKSDGAYPGTYSRCLEGVAYNLRALGKLDEAEPLLKENVEFCKKKYGETTTSYGNALNSLAHLQAARKDYKEALKNYTTAADLYAKKYGKKHADFAVVSLGAGSRQGQLKQYKKAETTYRESLATFRKKLGAGHQLTIDAHNGLASLFDLMIQRRIEVEKFELAREAAEKKVKLKTEFYGDKHWSVFSAKDQVASR